MLRWNHLNFTVTGQILAATLWLLAAAAPPASAALTPEETQRVLNDSLDHFYNLEYDQAIAGFERLREDNPSSAKWQNHAAMGYFYKQLYQGGTLEGDLFDASNKFFKTKNFPLNAYLDKQFQQANRKAIEICENALKRNGDDLEALYSCGVAYAVRATHQGLIERSAFQFLGNARKANGYHTRLARAAPRQYDAYLIPGLFDFVLGSLPGPVKVLFFFAGLNGDKERGIGLVENVSDWGDSAQQDARILLTVMYRREKRYADARRMLEMLAKSFPRNYILPLEIASTYRAADDLPEAIRAYEHVLEQSMAGAPNFELAPAARIHFELGVLYERTKDLDAARRHFSQVATSRGATAALARESALNLDRLRDAAQ